MNDRCEHANQVEHSPNITLIMARDISQARLDYPTLTQWLCLAEKAALQLL